jgi:peptidoglycan/xylan/chitin deacetylase (PgdA/CDA1 family)
MIRNRLYYALKPLIPRRVQIFLRRQLVLRKKSACGDVWPIDEQAGNPPAGWSGWPEGKKFALVLTHDVDTEKGHRNCKHLAELEKEMGFRSSFNFVAKRYDVSPTLRRFLVREGFEVGLHGLYHDGKYYKSRNIFRERAVEMNKYLASWGAVGFRSPSMHHNLDWIHDLNIDYDASTFDTDPFEPQPDGMGTIFPFFVNDMTNRKGYVELPYTLPQDFTLFSLMREKNIDIWKKKVAWIAQKGGMALINVHPDYMKFDGSKPGLEEYPAKYYRELLEYVKDNYHGQYWHVLPKDIAKFWLTIMSDKLKTYSEIDCNPATLKKLRL